MLGNMNNAKAFSIKTTTNENEIWLSSASIIGDMAAIALPPQIAVPEVIKILNFWSIFSNLPNKIPKAKVADTEITVIKKPVFDVSITWSKFIPKPISTIATCSAVDLCFEKSLLGKPIKEKPIPISSAIAEETNGKKHNPIAITYSKFNSFGFIFFIFFLKGCKDKNLFSPVK